MVLIAPVVKFEGLFDRFASIYYEIAGVLPDYLQKIMLSNGFGKKIGDMVIFSKYAYDEVKSGNDEYVMVKEENVLAIIK